MMELSCTRLSKSGIRPTLPSKIRRNDHANNDNKRKEENQNRNDEKRNNDEEEKASKTNSSKNCNRFCVVTRDKLGQRGKKWLHLKKRHKEQEEGRGSKQQKEREKRVEEDKEERGATVENTYAISTSFRTTLLSSLQSDKNSTKTSFDHQYLATRHKSFVAERLRKDLNQVMKACNIINSHFFIQR